MAGGSGDKCRKNNPRAKRRRWWLPNGSSGKGALRVLERLHCGQSLADMIGPVQVRMDEHDLAVRGDDIGGSPGQIVVPLAVHGQRDIERLNRRRRCSGYRKLASALLLGELGEI